MEAVHIIITLATALALPVLLGGLWLSIFVPAQGAGRTALVWGCGTLIGLLLIPQLMLALDALDIPLTFRSIASLAGALVALALVVLLFTGARARFSGALAKSYADLPASHKALFIFLLSLIILRMSSLGLEVFLRPLYPWDATMHWATKARVWYEYNSIAPFVDNAQWLELGGKGVFTDVHANYPATVPLLQVWMSLAMAQWNPSLMNLPWLLCFMALGAAFYGQLRVSGVGPVISMAFTYFLLSMPLLNIHVALAGYADLFLGAAYCGALMAFHNWASTRQRWQAVLALVFALSCPLIKNEGVIWSLTFIPALIFTLFSRGDAAKPYVLFALLLVLLWLLLPPDLQITVQIAAHGTTTQWLLAPPALEIAGHALNDMIFEFHAEGLVGIVQSIWLHDNWHLMGYLLLAVLPLGILMPGALVRTYLELTIALGTAVGAFLFLFLFTGFGVAASEFTGVGRIGIQLAPGLLYLAALLCSELLTRGGVRATSGTSLPAAWRPAPFGAPAATITN